MGPGHCNLKIVYFNLAVILQSSRDFNARVTFTFIIQKSGYHIDKGFWSDIVLNLQNSLEFLLYETLYLSSKYFRFRTCEYKLNLSSGLCNIVRPNISGAEPSRWLKRRLKFALKRDTASMKMYLLQTEVSQNVRKAVRIAEGVLLFRSLAISEQRISWSSRHRKGGRTDEGHCFSKT